MIIHNPILTGSFTVNGVDVLSITGSAANITSLNAATASLNTFSASMLTFTASAATTGSNTFVGNQVVTGSLTVTGSITTPGTLTAQTLVVQTVTSSVVYSSGSNVFGNNIANTQVFTGSMSVSGSANFRTSQNFIVSSSSTGWVSGFINDYNNAVFIGVDNDGMYFQPTSKGTKLVAGNGVTYLYVTSSGVGIGTTNPSQLLEVVGGEIKAGRVDSSNEGGQVSFGRSTDNATAWYIDAFGNTSSPQLRFVNVANSVVAMTITGSDVGIGNSGFASTRLTVTGKSNSSSDYSFVANNASNSNLFLIRNDGWCIINANKGAEALQVNNTRNSTGDYAMVTTLGSNCNNTSAYHYIAATGGADRFYLFGNGTYQTVSDARLKKNITTVTDTYLDKVKDLRIVNYNWNDQEDGSDLELGMIAQEVEELIPSIVYEGREQEDGNLYKGIQVSSLPYILIKAIQELKAEIDELKNK
jgi:hypothetical protein